MNDTPSQYSTLLQPLFEMGSLLILLLTPMLVAFICFLKGR